ncbi:MAG: hypothetical protein J6E48_03925, partial [Prevotella sp.]|nr:hypothetical protein [Prevotella sp.]
MVKKLLLSSAALALVACASAKSDVAIRLNQVGYFPNEEKVVVIEGINPAGKIQVKNLQGKTVLKPRNIRQAQSPWGDKTRYVVDISDLKKEGDYEVCVAGAKAPLRIARHALHDISVAS